MFLVSAEIILQLTDLLANETNKIQFVCQAIGVPLPYITWYFNGVMLNLSEFNSSLLSLNESIIESSLSILNIQSSDVGTYTCEAENIIGRDHSSGVITVNGKYSISYIRLYYNITITDAVEIIEPLIEKIKDIKEGENITLSCVGAGYPPPLVQWRKLNGSLSDRVSSSNMSMSTNKGNVTRVAVDLHLRSVSREDTGIYVCSASNLLNNITRNIILVVQCINFVSNDISGAYCVLQYDINNSVTY